jgi:pimeloyl-ACP methyl ester carboxylesterase
VTASIGVQNKGHCRAIHLTQPFVQPLPESLKHPNDATKQALAKLERYQQWDSGYAKQQSTRPQTLGYGLTDSPVAQATWIIEKFWSWTDCSGHPENILTRDELLDNVMLYWLPATGVSAARLYWESFNSIAARSGDVTLPMGWSMFPKEIITPPREWVEARFKKLVYWNEAQKGGHFAAFEQPALFVEEIRRFHDAVR